MEVAEKILRAAMNNAKKAAEEVIREAMEEFAFLRLYSFEVAIDANHKDNKPGKPR